MVKDIYSDILEGNSFIDELILLKKNSLTTDILNFRKKLRQEKFDLAVDLQGLFRSGLIGYISGAPVRVGFSNARELATIFYTHKVDAPIKLHAVDRNLKLAEFLGCEIRDIKFPLEVRSKTLSEISDFLKKKGIGAKHPLVILAPGSRWEKKCWPPKSFSKLGDLLAQELRAVVILIGNNQEKSLLKEIKKEMTVSPTVVIDFTLSKLAGLLKMADVMVTNDSGPMHIAAAAGAPIVALFGPTNPNRTGPYTNKKLVIQKHIDCTPCFRKPCIYKHFVCMESIAVKEVFESVKQILK